MSDIDPQGAGAPSRAAKEAAFGQRGMAVWLFGLSGAGKSTIAGAIDRRLIAEGVRTVLLDGDDLRAGLNRGLGFSDADRAENLRRAAEVARIIVDSGLVAICAFITPLEANRRMIREIIGETDVLPVFVSASFETCRKRDPKGLYLKAAEGSVRQFTGRDSRFEMPEDGDGTLVIDSEHGTVEAEADRLYALVLPKALRRKNTGGSAEARK